MCVGVYGVSRVCVLGNVCLCVGGSTWMYGFGGNGWMGVWGGDTCVFG